MSRRLEKQRRRDKKKQRLQTTGFWTDLCDRIDNQRLTPIISSAVSLDPIFDIDGDGILGISREEERDAEEAYLSINDQLARAWAEELEYPLGQDRRMARVALYNSVTSTSTLAAKTGFVRWLKGELLFQAEEDPDVDPDMLEELEENLDLPLSTIAHKLGYPKPVAGQHDPLDLLARLRLPVYVTTSYFDFLERALIANGLEPRTQVCFWNGEPRMLKSPSHILEQEPQLSTDRPIVYHLFGHEAYPDSLVLTEDDCLDFLLKLTDDDADPRKQIVPKYLRKTLSLSSVLLLGYQPSEWDFRVLFRGLIAATSNFDQLNLAVQFDPNQRGDGISAQETKDYLEKYFTPTFTVEWDSDQGFAARLYEEWDRRRR